LDVEADLGSDFIGQAKVRLMPYDGTDYGSTITSNTISLSLNDSPAIVITNASARTDGSGLVDITYTGIDDDNMTVTLSKYQYSTGDGYSTMTASTGDANHDGISNLFTTVGLSYGFVWDSIADLGDDDFVTTVSIILEPDDGNTIGPTDTISLVVANTVTAGEDVDEETPFLGLPKTSQSERGRDDWNNRNKTRKNRTWNTVGRFLSTIAIGDHVVSVSSSYEMENNDRFVDANPQGVGMVISLPDTSVRGHGVGRTCTIFNSSATTITIDGNGSRIDGLLTVSLTGPYRATSFTKNNTQWKEL
jgi:hypothetical protein